MQILTSSKTMEWYTPPGIVSMVRTVMGNIGLDPASHRIPQEWIQAGVYYTIEDDGLSREWHTKTLFLNPPYGKTRNESNQAIWSAKLISEIRAGHVEEAIMLTKTVPGYKWWDGLFNGLWAGPMCITRDRISFVNSDGVIGGKSKAASSFWYHGPNESEFHGVFYQIGRVIFC